jgi:hypothetical protein
MKQFLVSLKDALSNVSNEKIHDDVRQPKNIVKESWSFRIRGESLSSKRY